MPKFSIVIPCFNAADTIDATLASIRNQTFTDWEIICVDDGSTDDTLHRLRLASLKDRRIRYVFNMGDGPSAARNQGALAHATAALVAFCDADDLWTRGKLAELAQIFDTTDADAAFGQVGFFEGALCGPSADAGGKPVSTLPDGALSIDALLAENPVCTMSNMSLRRHVFAATGGFDEGLVHNEDLEWLIRLVGGGAKVMPVRSLQTWYRNSVGGLSANLVAMRAGRRQALATARRYGVSPSRVSHAVYYRHLARRALRSGSGRFDAFRFAATGLRHSPSGFLSPLRRGGPTLIGSICAMLLPRSVSNALFS